MGGGVNINYTSSNIVVLSSILSSRKTRRRRCINKIYNKEDILVNDYYGMNYPSAKLHVVGQSIGRTNRVI